MPEDTRTIDTEREALIQEMLRDAKPKEIPGDLTTNPILHKGDETLQAPMIVKEISSAGYVYVWDTRTYEKIPILYYMLPAKMRQRREDGSYRFTTNDPKKLPFRGTLKCMLHKDDPNRSHYDEMGFRVCSKANLTNPYERMRHMRLKHPKEWDAIESERIERERKEDRVLQRAIIEKIAGSSSLAIGEKSEVKAEVKNKSAFICDICGADFGLQKSLENHKKEQHK